MDLDPPNAAFDSIESAQEYLALLGQVIAESQEALGADLQAVEQASVPRRLEALRLIKYKLEKLGSHIAASRRILNDLRMLRRVVQQKELAE